MPFKVTSQCSGKDTVCEDVCPYDCITTSAAHASNGALRPEIDAQFCVDCGMCALACPEKAIVYAGPFQPMTLAALGEAVWMRPRPKRVGWAITPLPR